MDTLMDTLLSTILIGLGAVSLLYLIAVLIVGDATSWYRALALAVLLSLALITPRREIPGTDGMTLKDVKELIAQCEETLPRDQKCVIDVGVRAQDPNEDTE